MPYSRPIADTEQREDPRGGGGGESVAAGGKIRMGSVGFSKFRKKANPEQIDHSEASIISD